MELDLVRGVFLENVVDATCEEVFEVRGFECRKVDDREFAGVGFVTVMEG
jgi:hypothetical protein